MTPEAVLPFLILLTGGLGALVIAAVSAFVAARGPTNDRREAVACCVLSLIVAALIGAVLADPAFGWRP